MKMITRKLILKPGNVKSFSFSWSKNWAWSGKLSCSYSWKNISSGSLHWQSTIRSSNYQT
jgi:hypothetical protein